MDPFAISRATFDFYLRLMQLPFEVGLRLLGATDDRIERPATHSGTAVGESRQSTSRQRKRTSGGKAAGQRARTSKSRGRGAASTETRRSSPRDRQRPASRREPTHRETSAGERGASEPLRTETTGAGERTGDPRGEAERRATDAALEARERVEASAELSRLEQLEHQAQRLDNGGDGPSAEDAAEPVRVQVEREDGPQGS